MSDWITVTQQPLTRDLGPLVYALRARGVDCRVTEAGGDQYLAVRDAAQVAPVAALVEAWLAGELELPARSRAPRARPIGLSPWRTPATLVLIALSLLGAALPLLAWPWLHWFTFQDFTLVNHHPVFEPLGEGIGAGQWWRLLTPAFIHFGLFHILFNSLWLWELGRRVELQLGVQRYLLVIVTWAIGANIGQYLWDGPGLFGGMSGVVYALVGYLWLRQRLTPEPLLAVPPGIIGFMLVWMALCLSGIVDYFIQGSVANGAHVVGLLIGMAWGAISGIQQLRRTGG